MIYLNEDERYLSAHISDLVEQSSKSGVPRFSRFLNERERVVATDAAMMMNTTPIFYGGYDGAARTICGFFGGTYAEDYPEVNEDFTEWEKMSKRDLFPVCAVTFSFRRVDALTHRDFLGSALGAGLERSMIGDILVSEEYAVLFCTEAAFEIAVGITKIGRYGVKAERGITRGLPEGKTEAFDRTLSSLRLDCVVGACTNLSRDKSASLIKSGLVSADFLVCQNVSYTIKEGTVLSIRGYGRFRLTQVMGETKKGRLRVSFEKSI